MHAWYAAAAALLCRSATRHPWRWAALIALVSLPAAWGASHLDVDTDLIRLLPSSSRPSILTRQLDPVVSDGGSFTLMVEGADRARLLAAVEAAAQRVAAFPEVSSVQYRWPVEFFRQWRYLLIPNDYVTRIRDQVLSWEAAVSPFVEDLGDVPAAAGSGPETVGEEEDREDLKMSLRYYTQLSEYHESRDGRVMGMIVRTRQGVTSIGEIERLYGKLRAVAADLEKSHGVWAGVGGSHRNKIDEIHLIRGDIARAGTFSSVLIALVVLVSFRSLPALLLVFLPMSAGILWAFALVPYTVGDFNLVTAFIVGIMFGLGVENSIYLVKDFQKELPARGTEGALLATYLTTGPSVIISGLTTGFSLLLLTAVSTFRGFTEYGFIGFLAIMLIMASMFVVLPVLLVLAERAHLLPAYRNALARPPGPRAVVTAVLLAALVAAAGAATFGTRFDYNFRNFRFDRRKAADSQQVRERQDQVYASSMSPGAVYVAADIKALDALVRELGAARARPGSTIGRVRSLRDFVPDAATLRERRALLEEIREELAGGWTRRIKDEEQRRVIDDFRAWQPPAGQLGLAGLPEMISRPLLTKDGSGRFIVSVHPTLERMDARNAMAFGRELAALPPLPGVVGPIGETIVFGEILRIVLEEGPRVVLATLALVFAVVFAYQRSVGDTLLIVFPLISGIVLSLGAMAALGQKLNFFNIVVIPSLLGMGVDSGVHYFRRWRQHGGDVAAVQRELFEPMTLANWTTAIGYGGLLFANHPGIRSIGLFAVIGALCAWSTNLFLFPGLLDRIGRRRQPAPPALEKPA
jgi:predicted RND superfamily exporter protein